MVADIQMRIGPNIQVLSWTRLNLQGFIIQEIDDHHSKYIALVNKLNSDEDLKQAVQALCEGVRIEKYDYFHIHVLTAHLTTV